MELQTRFDGLRHMELQEIRNRQLLIAVLVAGLAGFLLGSALRSERTPGDNHPETAAPERKGGPSVRRAVGSGEGAPSAVPLSGANSKAVSLEELATLSEPDRLSYFLARFAADPAEAVLEAYRLDSSERRITWDSGYGNWLHMMLAEVDVDLAQSLVDHAETDESHRRYLRFALARELSWKSSAPPEERLEETLRRRDSTVDSRFHAALDDLSKSDPEAALSYLGRAIQERPELLRFGIDLTWLATLAEAAPTHFRALVETTTLAPLKRRMEGAWAAMLGKTDPPAGVELVESMPMSRARSLAAVHLAAGWGEADPRAAVRWASTRLHGTVRVRAVAAALPPGFVAENPAEVVALFRNLPEFPAVFEDNDVLNSYKAYTSTGGHGHGGNDLDSIPTAQAIYAQALNAMSGTDDQREINSSERTGTR